MKQRLSSTLLALVAALLLAACGGGGDDVNDADVTFAQDMLPHHRQAVEMAQLAQDHAATTEVKTLADEIDAAQGPEISTMTGWLEDWGQEVPDESSMDGMSMPGMMSDDEMAALDRATGPAFDEMFLTMMIAHHEGAIEMAKAEQSEGKNADAKALAKEIEDAQTSEIAEMEELLAR